MIVLDVTRNFLREKEDSIGLIYRLSGISAVHILPGYASPVTCSRSLSLLVSSSPDLSHSRVDIRGPVIV